MSWRNSRARFMAMVLLLLLVVGYAPNVKLRHPQTDREAECKGGYYTLGLIGMANPTAKELQMRCIDDFQRQGYDRVPE